MHKKFTRSFDSLEQIFKFTELFFDQEKIEESVRFPVHFAMEELFTNMVKYNPETTSDIMLKIDRINGGVNERRIRQRGGVARSPSRIVRTRRGGDVPLLRTNTRQFVQSTRDRQ